jgi:WD40 repeat protein
MIGSLTYGEGLHLIRYHSLWIRSVVFSHDDNFLGISGNDGSILICKISDKIEIAARLDFEYKIPITSLSFSYCDKFFASGHSNKKVITCDFLNPICLEEFSDGISNIQFNPKRNLLAISYWNNISIYEYNSINNLKISIKLLVNIVCENDNFISSIDFSRCGFYLISGRMDSKLYINDIYNAIMNKDINSREIYNEQNQKFIRDVKYSKTNKYIAVASDDKTIYFFS